MPEQDANRRKNERKKNNLIKKIIISTRNVTKLFLFVFTPDVKELYEQSTNQRSELKVLKFFERMNFIFAYGNGCKLKVSTAAAYNPSVKSRIIKKKH